MATTRNNYQLQARQRDPMMTVADLRRALEGLLAELPVVILSPQFGAFGSEMPYEVGAIDETVMPRMEHKIEALTYEDDETGETIHREEELQVWPEWHGVVLQGCSSI